MSTSEHRVGLGWEVWFLITVLGFGGGVLAVLAVVVLPSILEGPTPRTAAVVALPAPNPGRVIAGLAGAVMLMWAAVRLAEKAR